VGCPMIERVLAWLRELWARGGIGYRAAVASRLDEYCSVGSSEAVSGAALGKNTEKRTK
jgi:hypothetical protein